MKFEEIDIVSEFGVVTITVPKIKSWKRVGIIFAFIMFLLYLLILKVL